VTVLESKESEKGNNDSESSLLETETEAGMEAEMEAEAEAETCSWVFTLFGTVFSVKRTGESAFLWEGGITFLNDIMRTDRLCDERLGQDDEG
jgi:hypothetical protein